MSIRFLFAVLLGIAFLGFVVPTHGDDETSALINQQLDKQIKLTLDDLLPQAVDKITEQTGVPVKADPSVWELLPWGRDTNIKAKIENQTLREALDAMTRKLGLKWEVRDNAVMIEPMRALRRLARRATIQELGCLDALMGLQFDQAGTFTIKQLLDAVDAKLAAGKFPYVVERPSADTVPMDAKVEIPRNCTLMHGLEKMATDTPVTWYPWSKSVVVLSKQDEIRRQLSHTISARYNGTDVGHVLSDLSQKAGVPFNIEAGAIAAIPPESRDIRLVLDDYSIQSALENIGSITGLEFTIKDEGVYLWNQSTSPTHRDRALLMMPLAGTNTSVLITESEVPADIRQYIQQKKLQYFDDIREKMKAEGFKPTTSVSGSPPATQPVPATNPSNHDL
jgi:hypothetical protein